MALLDDGAFCEEDAAVLEGFRAYLGLDPGEAEGLFQEEARAYIRRRMLRFLADGKLTPAADHRLSDLVQAVGLSPQWDEEAALMSTHVGLGDWPTGLCRSSRRRWDWCAESAPMSGRAVSLRKTTTAP